MLAGESYPARKRALWAGTCTLPLFGPRRLADRQRGRRKSAAPQLERDAVDCGMRFLTVIGGERTHLGDSLIACANALMTWRPTRPGRLGGAARRAEDLTEASPLAERLSVRSITYGCGLSRDGRIQARGVEGWE